MKPEFILKADLLDILFENRNKEYGAYELRKQYNRRLGKSLVFVFLVLLSLYGIFYFKTHFFQVAVQLHELPTIPETILTKIVDLKQEIMPKEKPVPERRIAEVPFTKPIITRQLVVNPPPTQDQLADKIISNKNVDENKLQPNDIMPLNTSTKGNGLQSPQPEEKTVLDRAEYMPEFPGGLAALQRFLSRNLKTPKDDMEPGSKIRVLARFVVDMDGTITGIEIEQSGGNDFDNEVMRVMKKMPAWKPGKQNGRNVSVYFKIPVIFQATDDN
jgi:protein TonB